ncbi:acetylornithine deacetylase [Streptomyces sp. SS]|uniref:acetylornithine deacetylase n=1 Tax=Streptomyces sp. SS TaxID=260742 RepID=UPI00031A1FA6|nr:acetylornithine deacetylase [Streptomyces sp. SS]
MSSGFPVKRTGNELYAHMLGILERLVGFDTTSHNSNLELIGYVQDLLSANGIDSRLHFNEDRSKANLVATAGSAGDGRRGIVWSGHTDTVPVTGQAWTADPFTLRVTEDRAIGRGTADMKGFLACCLALLSTVDQQALPIPVTLVLTYDEEVGCVGARSLVEEMRTWTGEVTGCVVGEPTGMRVVVGHKGKQNYRLRLTGEPKHAALASQTANPIVSAAEFIGFAESLNERFRDSGPYDERFSIGHSWINVGRIEGGLKANIVPGDCTVELEIRNVPDHPCADIADELRRYTEGELLAAMRKRYAPAEAALEQLSDTPSFAMEPDHAFIARATAATGQDAAPEYVPFGTEAGLIRGIAGLPTVVCGPGFISEAHTADEFVPLDQLRHCLAHLQAIAATP